MSLAEVRKRLEEQPHMPFRGLKLTREDVEWLLRHLARPLGLPASFSRWRLRREAVRLDLRGAVVAVEARLRDEHADFPFGHDDVS